MRIVVKICWMMKKIQKITPEGLNQYHDGCTVLGALASTEEGLKLLYKYPSLSIQVL